MADPANPYASPTDPSASVEPASPRAPGKGSLAVIFLTVFIDLLGFGLVLPLLPLYGRQFAVDHSGLTLGLLMASFSAMQFVFAPLWGRLSDRIGRRPVLLVGLAGSVVFYALFGVATVYESLAGLFIARIGAGIAGATIPTAQAYIADSTTLEGRVKGMALIGAAFGLGFTFGPLLGFLAVADGQTTPGPWPGYAAAILSAFALALAIFKLPESLTPSSDSASRRVFDLSVLSEAVSTPSIGPLLLAMFVCVFSFANFETTLSLLIKDETGPFHLEFRQVCLTFAYIGITLTIAQGLIVRRLAKKVSEGTLATIGAVCEIVGFLLLGVASQGASYPMLYGSLTVIVTGFALLMPSLNSLVSRRTDPARQGGILGLGQSISALARILAPVIGIPMLHVSRTLPTWVATGLMLGGLGLVIAAARGGKDFVPANPTPDAGGGAA